MRVTIRIPRPGGCPCCSAEEEIEAMRLKSFIEKVKDILEEKAEIDVLFDSQVDTPNVSIDGKVLSEGRYPDNVELKNIIGLNIQ